MRVQKMTKRYEILLAAHSTQDKDRRQRKFGLNQSRHYEKTDQHKNKCNSKPAHVLEYISTASAFQAQLCHWAHILPLDYSWSGAPQQFSLNRIRHREGTSCDRPAIGRKGREERG
jgi:hypothetical protein